MNLLIHMIFMYNKGGIVFCPDPQFHMEQLLEFLIKYMHLYNLLIDYLMIVY